MQAAPCLTQFSRNLETLSLLQFWQGRMRHRDRYQSLPARTTRPAYRPWRPPCPSFCDGINCRRCAAGRLACCSQRSCFYTPPRGSPCCCRRQGAAQWVSGIRKKSAQVDRVLHRGRETTDGLASTRQERLQDQRRGSGTAKLLIIKNYFMIKPAVATRIFARINPPHSHDQNGRLHARFASRLSNGTCMPASLLCATGTR